MKKRGLFWNILAPKKINPEPITNMGELIDKEEKKETCGNCNNYKAFYFGKGKPLRGYCGLKETDIKTDSSCEYHQEVH